MGEYVKKSAHPLAVPSIQVQRTIYLFRLFYPCLHIEILIQLFKPIPAFVMEGTLIIC